MTRRQLVCETSHAASVGRARLSALFALSSVIGYKKSQSALTIRTKTEFFSQSEANPKRTCMCFPALRRGCTFWFKLVAGT